MTKLFAFGDSFVVGDLDDFGPSDFNYNPEFPPKHNMSYDQRLEYLKQNVSFAALISKELLLDYENFAVRGCGNLFQLDKLLLAAKENKLKEGDIILFGISYTERDRLSMVDYHRTTMGIIADDLRNDHKKLEFIGQFDLYLVLSVLESIRRQYKVKICAFNLFFNVLFNEENKLKYNFDFFIGSGLYNNTLIDVLNDTWAAAPKSKHLYHTQIKIPLGYEKLYTWNKHPSELGHEKIKDWLLPYIKNINHG